MGDRFHQYQHISTATTTTFGNPGSLLHAVTINGGTAGVVTVRDGAGGTVIAVIETIGATNPTTLVYDVVVSAGISVVTAAATDVTVSYS